MKKTEETIVVSDRFVTMIRSSVCYSRNIMANAIITGWGTLVLFDHKEKEIMSEDYLDIHTNRIPKLRLNWKIQFQPGCLFGDFDDESD